MSESKLLKTEYLIVIDKKNTSALYNFLNSNKRFNELLEQDQEINIQARRNEIFYRNVSFFYNVKHGHVDGKDQKYFYVVIGNKGDLKFEYKDLLRSIKKIIYEENFILETLQDDLSFYYSQHAYSLIHEIENHMRKFITFFMVAIVGKDWVEDNAPKIVKDAIEKSKRKQYSDVLQQLDFKHLGDVLFSRYQNGENSKLLNKISSYTNVEQINLKELKDYVPTSNWDKFFKELVDCDDSYLKTRWNSLYELRNIVAHTSSLSEDKYNDIVNLVAEVRPKLQSAFEKLNTLKLKSNEKLAISESVATNVVPNLGLYFEELDFYEMELRGLFNEYEDLSFLQLVYKLKEDNKIDSTTFEKIDKMMKLKSKLIFESTPSDGSLTKLNKQLGELNHEIQSTWSRDVYFAFKSMGGKGSLEDVYSSVSETSTRKLSTSWRGSVRKAIYTNSSDADLFDGRFDIYKKVNKGIWMIRKDLDGLVLEKFLGEECGKNS
ncbi:hypothetical protein AB6D85_03490 [Vibrio splendidus]